jgi:hypothetical protein
VLALFLRFVVFLLLAHLQDDDDHADHDEPRDNRNRDPDHVTARTDVELSSPPATLTLEVTKRLVLLQHTRGVPQGDKGR